MPEDLKDVIRKTVEAELAPARILDVRLHEDVDHDGDPIPRISVVFEAKDDRLNPRSMVGLARHLREPLERLQVDAFPVFRFLTARDAAGEAALPDRHCQAPGCWKVVAKAPTGGFEARRQHCLLCDVPLSLSDLCRLHCRHQSGRSQRTGLVAGVKIARPRACEEAVHEQPDKGVSQAGGGLRQSVQDVADRSP